jgi:ribose transport system substrate-binding protein
MRLSTKWSVRFIAGTCCAALAVSAAGCGSDDEGGSSDAGTSAKATTTAAAAGSATDQAAALKKLSEGTETEPPASGPAPKAGATVWWISCGEVAPACSVPTAAAVDAAKVLGWKLKVADGKLNVAGGYNTAIRQAIAAKPDAIIVHADPCDAVSQSVKEAKAAGIITLNAENPSCGTKAPFTADMQYSSSAPSPEAYFQDWGRLAADYIAVTNPKAKIINSPLTADLGVQIEKGFTEQLTTKCPGCSIVKSIKYSVSDLIPKGAWITQFKTALLSSDADVAFVPFGVQVGVLGGTQAVKESGKKVVLLGGNGEADIMNAIRDGSAAACSGCHDAGWMAWAAMDTTNRLLNKEPVVPEGVGHRLVTKENVDQVTSGPDSTYTSPIDWKSAYTKSWAGGQ